MTDNAHYDDVPIVSDTVELVLVDTVEIKPFEQYEPRVTNSGRIDWLEQAYRLLREELLPEAPERISLTFGFP